MLLSLINVLLLTPAFAHAIPQPGPGSNLGEAELDKLYPKCWVDVSTIQGKGILYNVPGRCKVKTGEWKKIFAHTLGIAGGCEEHGGVDCGVIVGCGVQGPAGLEGYCIAAGDKCWGSAGKGSLECPGLSGIKCCIPNGSEPKFGFNPDVLFTNYVAAAPYQDGGDTNGLGSKLRSAADSSWSKEQPQVVQPLPDLNAANVASGNIDQPFPQPESLAVVASNLNGGGTDTAFFDTNGAGLGFNLPDVGSTAMWNSKRS